MAALDRALIAAGGVDVLLLHDWSGRILDVVRYCAGDVLAAVHVYRKVAPLLARAEGG